MPKRSRPSATLPPVLLGFYQVKDERVIANLVSSCLDTRDVDGLDTAEIYKNQTLLGKALKRDDDQRWVQTKLWRSVKQKDIEKTLRKDLSELRLSCVDCYLMHWPGPGRHLHYPPVTRTKLEEVGASNTSSSSSSSSTTQYKVKKYLNKNPHKVVQCPDYWTPQTRLSLYTEMCRCVDLGLTRSLGVCNFTLTQLRDLVDHCGANNLPTPLVLQNEFNPMIKFDKELYDYCKNNNIAYQGHSCLGGPFNGLLLSNPTVVSIASSLDVTPADVLFKYALNMLGNIIIKSVNPARIKSAVAQIKNVNFDLAPSDMKRLSSLSNSIVQYENFEDGSNGTPDSTTLFSWLKEKSPSAYN
mmetsp:Transcript_17385/g.35900  ORF Transcript_17385/g.35900 Transcript_17385/m.35900 type:complete len:356 (-) Transcript_17385:21-1088(-)